MSLVKNYIHIVFSTYRRRDTIPEDDKRALLAYIHTFCKDKKVTLKRINAYRNHVHMLINLPPTMALADFVGKAKAMSSAAFKGNHKFPKFEGWSKGYGAFSISHWDISKIISYIANQEQHHSRETLDNELRRIAIENGEDIDEFFDQQW